MLEAHGIPTVTIGTDAFTDLLALEAEQRGLPELERIIVPHPLGGLKPDAVRAKVPQIMDELYSALVAR